MCNLGEAIYERSCEFWGWVREALETDQSVEQILELGIQKGNELYRDPASEIQEYIEERFGVFIFLTKMSMEKNNSTLDEMLALMELPYREESVVRYYFSQNDELDDRVMTGAKKVFQRIAGLQEGTTAHAPQGDAKKP